MYRYGYVDTLVSCHYHMWVGQYVGVVVGLQVGAGVSAVIKQREAIDQWIATKAGYARSICKT